MEFGNLIFGHSRGEFPIERGRGFEGELRRLIEAIDPETGDCCQETDTSVFTIRPYYWGGCACGYEERVAAWEKANRHDPKCYQQLVNTDLAGAGFVDRWGLGALSMPERMPYCVGRAIEDKIRERWCKYFRLSFPAGCAVHCTCDYHTRWGVWALQNDHAPTCPIVLPNFHLKENDFQITWYKYPLRDSYSNAPFELSWFRLVIDRCIESLGTKGV